MNKIIRKQCDFHTQGWEDIILELDQYMITLTGTSSMSPGIKKTRFKTTVSPKLDSYTQYQGHELIKYISY